MDHEGIEYISPDAELVQELMQQVLDSEQGTVGIKLLPFVDDPGITYNYRVRFEDGTGEVIRERSFRCSSTRHTETPTTTRPASHRGDSIIGSPEEGRVRPLLEHERDTNLR